MTRLASAAAIAAALATCCAPAAAGTPSRVGYRVVVAGPVTPAGSPSQQTNPVVRPSRGHPKTRFVLALTARQRLGASEGQRADYRIAVTRAGGGCSASLEITVASAGAHLRRALHAPTGNGWCRGHYTGVVILDRAPACTQPPGGPPVACPDYVLAPVAVGRFSFTVV